MQKWQLERDWLRGLSCAWCCPSLLFSAVHYHSWSLMQGVQNCNDISGPWYKWFVPTDQPVLLIHGNFCLNVSRARHVPSERISPIQPELGATSAPSDLTRQTLVLHQRSCSHFHMNDTKHPFLISCQNFSCRISSKNLCFHFILSSSFLILLYGPGRFCQSVTYVTTIFFLQEDCCRMMIEGHALVYRPSAPLLVCVLCLVFLFSTSIGWRISRDDVRVT